MREESLEAKKRLITKAIMPLDGDILIHVGPATSETDVP